MSTMEERADGAARVQVTMMLVAFLLGVFFLEIKDIKWLP